MISTRRTLIGGAAALSLAPIVRPRAQGRVKLTIGVLTDLSGTYRDNTGPTSVAATQLAVDEMKSHLDCDVDVISADHQNKPDVAVSIARQWFDSGVDIAADVPTSSVALAVAQVAKEKDKMMLNASATVASLTDDQCSPNTIVWSFDTYENAHSTGGSLMKQGFKSWYIITANYAFGQSLETLTAEVVKKGGGEIKGTARYPFPDTTDFSSYLTEAQASGATVVGFANAGLDTENCIKQAAEFGLNNTMKLAPLLMFIQNPHSLGTQDLRRVADHRNLLLGHERPHPEFHQEAAGANQAEQLPEPGTRQFLRLDDPLHESAGGHGRDRGKKERTRDRGEDEVTPDR